MTINKLLISTFFIFSYYGCSSQPSHQERKSRVVEFHYGGYDDTVYAIIVGRVYEIDNKDSLLPLKDVQIKAEQNGKTDSTNLFGEFSIGLEKGIFSFIITKEGFKSLRITNYVSDPDQISSIKIALVKGEGLDAFELKPK